jgi:translation elongation factor EF-1beta
MDRSGNFTAAASVICNSDQRIKTDIEEIPDALEKVKKVSGYTFKRTDIDIPRQAGVLAQEIKEVLPEVVMEDDKGMYSVAYGNITALLIQALKEEVAKREALELRLSRFEEFFELAHRGL